MIDFRSARVAMVDCQVRTADVTLYPIIAAFLEVPREEFVPPAFREVAYAGMHLELGEGRIVPDPRVLAKMLDALNPGPDMLVLDIAPGLGYSSAVLARLAAAVVAVEENPEFARAAAAALADTGVDTVIVENRPHVEGSPERGPYDAVFVNGAIERLPEAIVEQIKPGGRIVALFMVGPIGHCRLGTRTSSGLAWRNVFDATAPVLLGFEKHNEFAF